jgi:hypothetical protein
MRLMSKRGGILGTAVITVLIAFCVVFMAATFIAKNMSVHSQETAHGRSTRIETPFGNAHISEDGAFSPESVGIPIYPGATRSDHGSPTLAVEPSSGDEGFTYSVSEYRTPDSLESVRQFYSRQTPHWIFSSEPGQPSRAEYSAGGYKRIVVLSRQHGQTLIALASTGRAAAN